MLAPGAPLEPPPFQEAGAGGQTSRGLPGPPALKMAQQDSSSNLTGGPARSSRAGRAATAPFPGPQLGRAKGRDLEPQRQECQPGQRGDCVGG